MKVRLRGCVLALVLAGAVQSQPIEPRCRPDSPYEREGNVADLRYSLYSLSALSAVLPNAADEGRLLRLADASVICLSNIYSLRARLVRGCEGIQPADYYRQLAADQRFVILLLRAVSGPPFPSAQLVFKFPQLMSSPADLASRGDMALSQGIAKRIAAWRDREGAASSNPLWVAGSELLGQRVPWNERELIPRARVPINRDLRFSGAPLAAAVANIEKGEWREFLYQLGDYYRRDQQ